MASQCGNIHRLKMYFHTDSKENSITKETIIQSLRHASLNAQKQEPCRAQTETADDNKSAHMKIPSTY